VVLDRRLPARLNKVSDKSEGSLAFLTRPDEDLVGVISNGNDEFNITVEKVVIKQNGAVWLFSGSTLELIPTLFLQIQSRAVEDILPQFLVQTKILQVPLYEWLAFLVGLPLVYFSTVLLNRLVSLGAGRLRRRIRRKPDLPNPVLLPGPVRLLLVAMIIRWTLSQVTLPLVGRQFWSTVAATLTICAGVWVGILITGFFESMARAHFEVTHQMGATSILRLGRRAVDSLIFVTGVLIGLHLYGMDITAALAGLGVGGIAVALAAQKTLENVIGGVSVIFDKAIHVGDLLSVGTTKGFVEYIGLRSTRIRTFDRTVVSVPNGQLATLQLENFGVRDKFLFNPTINLPCDTISSAVRAVVRGILDLLSRQNLVDRSSARVHLTGFAPYSLQVEVFAYVATADWVNFLDIQQGLLFSIMKIIEGAGSRIAIPAQISYLAAPPASEAAPLEPAISGTPKM
jgi:MscS family membrane protein